MTSLRVGNLGNALSVSSYAGIGVPGALVPETPTGADSGSMLNESVSRPADNAAEFRLAIVSGPTGGASFTSLNEDSSYTLNVPGDGVYTWTFNAWKDGVLLAGSPFTGTATIGATGVTITVTPSTVILGGLDPTPLDGDLVVTATASTLHLSALGAATLRGSFAISPAPSLLQLSALDPDLQTGGLVLGVAPSVFALGGLDPTPVRGALSIAVPASQVLIGALDPDIPAIGTVVSVDPAVVRMLGLPPSVQRGALVVTADPSRLALSALAPVPLAGDLVVSVAPSVLALSALSPSLLEGIATQPVYLVLDTSLSHHLAVDARLYHSKGLH